MKIKLPQFKNLHLLAKDKQPRLLDNENGFITIVVVLLMLAIITIIGVSAINNSITESSIVRNDTLYKRNFYFAESAGYEAATRLENAALTETNPTAGIAWVQPYVSPIVFKQTADLMIQRAFWWNVNGTPTDYTDDTWVAGNSVRSETFYTSNPANPSNLDILIPAIHTTDDIRLAGHFGGVAKKSSLKVTGPAGRLYNYALYGMYSDLAAAQGEALIEMGYRKRF